MKSKVLVQQALTMSVMFALVVTFSMVTLANSGNAVGELTVIGTSSPGDSSFVTVNGEAAKSGRTVFSSSTISTPDDMQAIVSFGKVGRLQFAPGTTFTIAANGDSISGDLTKGSLTVLNASQVVAVRTLSGDVVNVNAGETASATSSSAAKKKGSGPGGLELWQLLAIIGAGAAVAIYFATKNNCTSTASRTC